MAGLIDKRKVRDAKRLRKEQTEAVLQVARACFQRFPFAEVTLESVDKAVGLRAGKSGMLFGSKEELFLRVLSVEIDTWCTNLEGALDGVTDGDRVAEVLAESLTSSPEFLRWIGMLHIVLEGNIDGVAVHLFMHNMETRFEQCGALLERSCAALGDGEGCACLARLLLFAASMAAVAYPKGALALALLESDAAWLKIDLDEEIPLLISRVLRL